MERIDYDKYFTSEPIYDSNILITILEDIMGKTIKQLKHLVQGLQIVVTEKQIIENLKVQFEKENSELKRRAETGSLIEDDAWQQFDDEIVMMKYHFNPKTLEYLKKYTDIIRRKASELLNIIEQVGSKDIQSINDTLIDYDIKVENGYISKCDIMRLITPMVYNIYTLEKKIIFANDLSTYLTFKRTEHSYMGNEISECEIYPSESLQVKNLEVDYEDGNIRLSQNQEKVLKESYQKIFVNTFQFLKDI